MNISDLEKKRNALREDCFAQLYTVTRTCSTLIDARDIILAHLECDPHLKIHVQSTPNHCQITVTSAAVIILRIDLYDTPEGEIFFSLDFNNNDTHIEQEIHGLSVVLSLLKAKAVL